MLTLEEVRAELLAIIDANPTAKGQMENPVNNWRCCYRNPSTGDPVCLIGRFFANHRDIEGAVWGDLSVNQSVGDIDLGAFLAPDAADLLAVAQGVQDVGADYATAPTFRVIRQPIAEWEPDPDDNDEGDW